MTDYTNRPKPIPVDYIAFTVEFLKWLFTRRITVKEETGPLLLRDQFIRSCTRFFFTAAFYRCKAIEFPFLGKKTSLLAPNTDDIRHRCPASC